VATPPTDDELAGTDGSQAKVPSNPDKGKDAVLKIGYGLIVHSAQAPH